MTTKEKAAEALSKLEELDSRTIINVLNCYLTDEQLAEVYDELTEFEELAEDCEI